MSFLLARRNLHIRLILLVQANSAFFRSTKSAKLSLNAMLCEDLTSIDEAVIELKSPPSLVPFFFRNPHLRQRLIEIFLSKLLFFCWLLSCVGIGGSLRVKQARKTFILQ